MDFGLHALCCRESISHFLCCGCLKVATTADLLLCKNFRRNKQGLIANWVTDSSTPKLCNISNVWVFTLCPVLYSSYFILPYLSEISIQSSSWKAPSNMHNSLEYESAHFFILIIATMSWSHTMCQATLLANYHHPHFTSSLTFSEVAKLAQS